MTTCPSLSLRQGGERLKPQIVHSLANAELYCSCLANIYADPNYHNLSHWGIIQALARKGVYVAEPSDVALTETVLIQTGPIKMVSPGGWGEGGAGRVGQGEMLVSWM